MEKVKEVVHKAKDAVSGGHSSSSDSHPTTKPSTHEGPHSSGLANQADPRVDSDRDASSNLGAASHSTTTGTHGTHHGTHGTTGTTGTTGGLTGHSTTGHSSSAHPTTQPSTHVGPHSSGLANQVDPRVDSDRDASRNMGAASHSTTGGYDNTTGGYGTTGTTGGLTGHSTTGHSSSAHPTTQPSTHVGPHSSGLANQVDPRVDSDRDASRNMGAASHGTTGAYDSTTGGYGTTGTTGGLTGHSTTGTTGGYGTTGTTGGLTGHSTTGTTGGYGNDNLTGHSTTGTHGTTGAYGAQDPSSAHPTTKPSTHVGPHSSGLANQLDPRVDSDRDASKNMGLAKGHDTYTHDSSVPDASKHTPTEFAKLTGGVETDVRHAGDPADHRRRHSLKPTDTAGTLDSYGSGK